MSTDTQQSTPPAIMPQNEPNDQQTSDSPRTSNQLVIHHRPSLAKRSRPGIFVNRLAVIDNGYRNITITALLIY